MAHYYVDSTRTGGADTGGSWADAFLTIDQASTAATGDGDNVWVSSAHTETQASSNTVSFSTSNVLHPVRIVSVDTTGDPEPPTAGDYLAGASVQVTGTSNILSLYGNAIYVFGLVLESAYILHIGASSQVFIYRECTLRPGYSNIYSYSDVILGNNFQTGGELIDCTYRPRMAGITINATGNNIRINNLTIDAAAAAPNDLIKIDGTYAGSFVLENSDLSPMASGASVFESLNRWMRASVYNCRLPTSGVIIDSAYTWAGDSDAKVEAYNVGTGNTLYESHIENAGGLAVTQTTVYRDATYDGTNGYAFQLTPDVEGIPYLREYNIRFRLDAYWADASKTHTVEIFYDHTASLKDNEFWIDLIYPDVSTGTHGKTLSSIDTDFVVGSGTNLTTSALTAADWTGEPAEVNTHYFQKVTLDLNGLDQAGPHEIWVNYGIGATTPVVYVCPHVDVSA